MGFKFLPCYVLRGEHGEEKTWNYWGNNTDDDVGGMWICAGGS